MTDRRTHRRTHRPDDNELVTSYVAGDRTALAAIYDRYADSLHDTAAAMLRDPHEAADVLQDVILIAAQRLHQLRDPERLKPWLFAILRNQVYTRTTRRTRTRPVDFSAPEVPEMAAPTDPRAEAQGVSDRELAELVRAAAAGLDARDQLALEYTTRQELTGTDLADALGVSLEQSYVVVHRMRERVERAIGALTVARMGRRDCPELARTLAGWDGTFSVLIRKRVARHIDACDVCERTKHRVAVIPLMGAAPALAAPASLRESILTRAADPAAVPRHPDTFETADGFPAPPRSARVTVWLAAAVALTVVLAAAVAIAVLTRGDTTDTATAAGSTLPDQVPTATAPAPDPTASTSVPAVALTSTTQPSPATTTVPPATTVAVVSTTPPAATTVAGDAAPAPNPPDAPTNAPNAPTPTVPPVTAPPTTAPPPGRLTVSAAELDLGTSAATGTITLTNDGGSPLAWTPGGSIAPFTTPASGGTLAPGQSAVVEIALDRSAVAEGSYARDLVVSSPAGSVTVRLLATVDRVPAVAIVQGAPDPTCPPIEVPTIVARVTDASIASVVLSWSGPGASGSATMTGSGDWSAPLGVEYVDGAWTYVVTATDTAGHVGSVQATTVVQCPLPG